MSQPTEPSPITTGLVGDHHDDDDNYDDKNDIMINIHDIPSFQGNEHPHTPTVLPATITGPTTTPHGARHQRALQARHWITVDVSALLRVGSRFAHSVGDSIQQTRKYEPLMPTQEPPNGPRELNVRLWRADTLQAAALLHSVFPRGKIAVLNMANPTVPGGDLLNGSIAQEETLCMRTTLHRTLRTSFYPLKIPDVIYSPNVLVCRGFDGTWTGNDLSDADKFNIDVISAAAVARPDLVTRDTDSRSTYSDSTDANAMRDGILHIIQAAVDHQAIGLVLCAWGCGAFGNPIHEVAAMMKNAILGAAEGQLPANNWARRGLQEIVIAIYDQDEHNGFPVWNGFVDAFRVRRGPLPAGMQIVDTAEIHHVVRWPRSADDDHSHDGSGAAGGDDAAQALLAQQAATLLKALGNFDNPSSPTGLTDPPSIGNVGPAGDPFPGQTPDHPIVTSEDDSGSGYSPPGATPDSPLPNP